jgi:hypothetical protein
MADFKTFEEVVYAFNKFVATDDGYVYFVIEIDATGSMSNGIAACKAAVQGFAGVLRNRFGDKFKMAVVVYRDMCSAAEDILNVLNYTSDLLKIENFLSMVLPSGGGDDDEIDKMARVVSLLLKPNFIFKITDAFPHPLDGTGSNTVKECKLLTSYGYSYDWVVLNTGAPFVCSIAVGGDDRLGYGAVAAALTGGVCVIVPANTQQLVDNMTKLLDSLTNGADISGLKLCVVDEIPTSESAMLTGPGRLPTRTVTDPTETRTILASARGFFNTGIASRTAKRARPLGEFGKMAVQVVADLQELVPKDLTSSLCDSMTLSTVAEELPDVVEQLEELDKGDPEFMMNFFELVERLVLGYPIYLDIPTDGKFQLQDIWMVRLESVKAGYVFAAATVINYVDKDKGDVKIDKSNLGAVPDLIRNGEINTIVPMASIDDPCATAVMRILSSTDLLNAVAFHLVHRHIYPIPHAAPGLLGAAAVTLLKQDSEISTKALMNVIWTWLKALKYRVCKDQVKALKDYDGSHEPVVFAPHAPFNVASLSKILAIMAQLPEKFHDKKLRAYLLMEAAACSHNVEIEWPAMPSPDEWDPMTLHPLETGKVEDVAFAVNAEMVTLASRIDRFLRLAAAFAHDPTSSDHWLELYHREPAFVTESPEVLTGFAIAGHFKDRYTMGADLKVSGTTYTLFDNTEHCFLKYYQEHYANALKKMQEKRASKMREVAAEQVGALLNAGDLAAVNAFLGAPFEMASLKYRLTMSDVPVIFTNWSTPTDNLEELMMLLCTGSWGGDRRFRELDQIKAQLAKLKVLNATTYLSELETLLKRNEANRHGHRLWNSFVNPCADYVVQRLKDSSNPMKSMSTMLYRDVVTKTDLENELVRKTIAEIMPKVKQPTSVAIRQEYRSTILKSYNKLLR